MRYTLTSIFLSMTLALFGQDQQEKISSQLYYLQEARANLSFAKNYADSTKVIQTMDSIDMMMSNLISYLEAIVVETPTPVAEEDYSQVEPIEAEPPQPPADEENPEDMGDYGNGDDMPENTDMGLGNPIIDKFNPFKKMKSKVIIETGINNFFMSLTTLDSEPIVNPGASWFWNFGLVKIVPLSNKVSIEAGVTYLRNRFKFSNDVRLISEGNGQVPGFTSIPNASEDPKLIAHYFTLPLVFNWKLTKTFHISLGGFGGYNIGAGQKITLKEKEEEIEEYRHGAYGLNKWIYGVKAGLGLGGFDLFGQLSFANFFESNSKYDYKTYMIGTSFKF